jgi:23S rRNA (guanosine2251-2'-O)-methyltransferase
VKVLPTGWQIRINTVKAALENPARRIRRLYATANAARRLGPDAVHNGLLAEADPLPSPELEELDPAGIVLVLDQITDPHNVGAILRTAAAFGVRAVVTTWRHSPEATGMLAKSASGALEYVPIVTVQNLARAAL